ncbi:T-complex 1 subunit delta [Olea europaea subsp. europaea]|uniref:T-complex 1 subunit delta n=1 Tax=Olea europaea subsp. europaea TaxID=158383 RepID=A0A8S0SCL9_OLEEU|nr:T-complex 1 subunit delta [Olea europaea subsp. europaea]
MEVLQLIAKFPVQLSKSQDLVAGDGTTTVVDIAGALLKASLTLLSAGIHRTVGSDALHKASIKAAEILSAMAIPVELSDHDSLVKSTSTSLNSKVVSQYSSFLAPLAFDYVLSVVDPAKPDLVDLKDIIRF